MSWHARNTNLVVKMNQTAQVWYARFVIDLVMCHSVSICCFTSQLIIQLKYRYMFLILIEMKVGYGKELGRFIIQHCPSYIITKDEVVAF